MSSPYILLYAYHIPCPVTLHDHLIQLFDSIHVQLLCVKWGCVSLESSHIAGLD